MVGDALARLGGRGTVGDVPDARASGEGQQSQQGQA